MDDKAHKTVESKELLDEVLEKILKDKIFEEFLIEHFMSICRELGYADMSVKVAEARYKDNPNDQNSALRMFDTYVATNDFMKMNATSMKIATTFKLDEYSIHSIQSLYLLSQSPNSPPNIIDLAFMFAQKHMEKFSDSDQVFPADGKLYLKILKVKKKTQEALEFLEKHPETYSSELELARAKIDILRQEVDSSHNEEFAKKLIKVVSEVIKRNYEKPAEFNCIYDLYEILVETLVDVVGDQVKEHSLEEIYEDVRISEAKEDSGKDDSSLPTQISKENELFSLEYKDSYSIESIKNLWSSLLYYQDFEVATNKSTEAHNLRKASILSQLYLMHKLKLKGIKYDELNPKKNVFSEI